MIEDPFIQGVIAGGLLVLGLMLLFDEMKVF